MSATTTGMDVNAFFVNVKAAMRAVPSMAIIWLQAIDILKANPSIKAAIETCMDSSTLALPPAKLTPTQLGEELDALVDATKKCINATGTITQIDLTNYGNETGADAANDTVVALELLFQQTLKLNGGMWDVSRCIYNAKQESVTVTSGGKSTTTNTSARAARLKCLFPYMAAFNKAGTPVPAPPSKPNHTAAIVGGTIGGLVAATMVGVLAWKIHEYKRKRT